MNVKKGKERDGDWKKAAGRIKLRSASRNESFKMKGPFCMRGMSSSLYQLLK